MIKDTLLIAGTWLLSDAVYSYSLYTGSQSWRGTRQTWAKDHWVRLLRAMIAAWLIILGLTL
jgi:hypothetical protein